MTEEQRIPTVRVVSDHPEHGGYIVINTADLQPHHVLFEEKRKPGRPRKC